MRPKESAYLLIGQGTRDREKKAFLQGVREFQRVRRNRKLEAAFFERTPHPISQKIDACVRGGAREIFIVPLGEFRRQHRQQDIPAEIQKAKRRFPEVDFHFAGGV